MPGAALAGGQQVVLRPDPKAAAAGRDFVHRTCLLWGLEATLDAAVLVVSELVTNAVVHGRSQVTVRLRLRLRPDRLLIEVEDEDSRLPVLQDNDWDALGGRGLMLVDALAARWGSQPCPCGKLVWAELPLLPDPSASGSARTEQSPLLDEVERGETVVVTLAHDVDDDFTADVAASRAAVRS